jgi:hypothetical protein
MGAVHIDGRTSGRTLEPRSNRGQHIVVGMLDGMEVVLAARHWKKIGEKVKGEFDGDHPVHSLSP